MVYNAGIYHLLALFCTLGVEGTGMALWAHVAFPDPKRAVACALVINLVTHTLFWYSQPLFAVQWPWGLYFAELIVVLIEGTLYACLLFPARVTPWLLSLLLNLASLIFGFWLWQILL